MSESNMVPRAVVAFATAKVARRAISTHERKLSEAELTAAITKNMAALIGEAVKRGEMFAAMYLWDRPDREAAARKAAAYYKERGYGVVLEGSCFMTVWEQYDSRTEEVEIRGEA